VYVGKISPLVDDDLMRAVLESCGPLRSWKRSVDPLSGAPKRFGFAEFDGAEGVLRAVRVLRDRPLAGSPLLVNLSAAAQRYLDFHAEQIRSRARAQGATIVSPPQAAPGGAPVELPVDAAGEAETSAKIEARSLVSSRRPLLTPSLLAGAAAGAPRR
jgi:RNA-binding protein 25